MQNAKKVEGSKNLSIEAYKSFKKGSLYPMNDIISKSTKDTNAIHLLEMNPKKNNLHQ